jgi:hypothetical protein
MRIRVRVSQRDINTGQPMEDTQCPIAKAFRRASGKRNVEVTFSRIFIGGMWSQHSYSYKLPSSAINFIRRFDDGKKVKPFEFTVERPDGR